MDYLDIPGWSCPVLLRLYDEIAAELQPGQIFVEVGVAYGKSLAYFAGKAREGVQILGVDSWLVKMGRGSPDVWEKVKGYKTAYEAALLMIHGALSGNVAPHGCAPQWWSHPALNQIELCRGNSVDVARALDFQVDAVFLDGSHEYDAVRADILAWLPRVKRGGLLAGHDINDHYPGVGQAVRELLPGAEVRPAEEAGNWGGCWTWRVK